MNNTPTTTPSNAARPTPTYSLHAPDAHDGVRMWQLTCETLGGEAEVDSRETFLLLSRHFRQTSLVADCDDGRLAAFVIGWRPPETPDILFLWRLCVAEDLRRQGLARRMLGRLLREPCCGQVRYLETLVTPSQRDLRKLMASFARDLGASIEVDVEMSRHDFQIPDGSAPPHEEENRFCIGPIEPEALGNRGLIGRG